MKVLYDMKMIDIEELPEGRFMIKDSCHFHWTPPYIPKNQLENKIKELGYKAPEVRGPPTFADNNPKSFIIP